jgi:formamidopyrimidine-DNA glycosylase
MPELPDVTVTVTVEHLQARLAGDALERVRIAGPFLLRTVDPPLEAVFGKEVLGCRRLGKRIVIELAGDLFLALHLMIAGRLRWLAAGAAVPRKSGLAAFDFTRGTLLLIEASTRKRAALHVLRGEADVRALDRGGLEVLDSDLASFRAALAREPHTLRVYFGSRFVGPRPSESPQDKERRRSRMRRIRLGGATQDCGLAAGRSQNGLLK